MWRLVYLLVGLVLHDLMPVKAADRLELDYKKVERPDDASFYRMSGHNNTDQPQIIVIKITDKLGAPYHQRVNEERWVLPGDFNLLVQPSALQTPRGRFLDLDNLQTLTLFSPADITFKRIIRMEEAHPPKQYAFDFGSDKSPVFMGFQKVTSQSDMIYPRNTKGFIRQGQDSLIRDGIKGITKLTVPIENGIWRVSLWTEDTGAWETLPALYERRIRINWRDRSLLRRTHEEWVRDRYLAGKRSGGKTPWADFGERRGGLKQFEVKITDGLLVIELAGSNRQATTVTGLLIDKPDDALFEEVQHDRKSWFTQRWPYVVRPDLKVKLEPTIRAFAGETIFVPSEGAQLKSSPKISVTPYYPQKAFHRKTVNSGLLEARIQRFSPYDTNTSSITFNKITIPSNLPTGNYDLSGAKVHVLGGLDIKLGKSIGTYLEAPPHIKSTETADRQVWCDLYYLRSLGLTAIAPPFSANITDDYLRADAFGFREILAYTPAKRDLMGVRSALKRNRFANLYFSIADEPSNKAASGDVVEIFDFLQNETPFAKKAGHFNNPKDIKLLKYVDLALINDGFGVDKADILAVKQQVNNVWFYNMENVRVATGFYLWSSGVDGYLQWHGRMPTADPFDPTDGREDDVQLLYPSETACLEHPDIDISLIEMVNGLSDLRWLTWLDRATAKYQSAKMLRHKIQQNIPDSWDKAQRLSPQHWRKLKNEIQDLAFHLHFHP